MKLFILFIFIFMTFQSTNAHAEDFKVIELFTSQSCSSCPPADKLLSEIATQEDVIALGCHVDYWDHLHWKDTYSQAFCTNRQRVYNAVLDEGVYTPQVVINGAKGMVGSRIGAVRKAIDKAEAVPALPLTLDGETLVIDSSILVGRGHIGLSIFGYGATEEQEIGSGENKGHNVAYANPVNMLANIEYDGTTARVTYGLAQQTAGYAVTAHDGQTGAIIAAGKLP